MKIDDILVTGINEHEDGSATFEVEMDPETFAKIFNHGFVALVKKGLEHDKSYEQTRTDES